MTCRVSYSGSQWGATWPAKGGQSQPCVVSHRVSGLRIKKLLAGAYCAVYGVCDRVPRCVGARRCAHNGVPLQPMALGLL